MISVTLDCDEFGVIAHKVHWPEAFRFSEVSARIDMFWMSLGTIDVTRDHCNPTPRPHHKKQDLQPGMMNPNHSTATVL